LASADKRIVKEPTTEQDVWWGRVNIPMEERSFLINRERAVDYLNTQERLFVIDGYAGWNAKFRMKSTAEACRHIRRRCCYLFVCVLAVAYRMGRCCSSRDLLARLPYHPHSLRRLQNSVDCLLAVLSLTRD
jgi:hypothetical protein